MTAKRTLRFKMKDGTFKDFEIEKFTTINGKFAPFVFHLDHLKAGKCRLTVSHDMEINKVDSIEIMREDYETPDSK